MATKQRFATDKTLNRVADELAKANNLKLSGLEEIAKKTLEVTFKIEEDNTEITVKNLTGLTSIDWGDGTIIPASNETTEYTHSYSAGTYTARFCDVTEIGEEAFFNIVNVTAVRIPDSVTTLGYSAFCDCASLANVVIPDSVTTIGDYAFSSCRSLTSVFIPDSVTTIGSYAFAWCDNLTSVSIGNSVTTIVSYAFALCDNLTSVSIGNSVTTIGDYAFFGCTNLTDVTIPESVNSIGETIFDSEKLTVTMKRKEPPTSSTNSGWGLGRVSKVIVPFESIDAYKNSGIFSYVLDKLYACVLVNDLSSVGRKYQHNIKINHYTEKNPDPEAFFFTIINSSSEEMTVTDLYNHATNINSANEGVIQPMHGTYYDVTLGRCGAVGTICLFFDSINYYNGQLVGSLNGYYTACYEDFDELNIVNVSGYEECDLKSMTFSDTVTEI